MQFYPDHPTIVHRIPVRTPPDNAEDAATRQLIQATAQGRTAEVIQALEAGARIDENRASFVDIGRQSPLLAAALLGHHRIVRFYLSAVPTR